MGGDGHGESAHYAGVEQEFGLFALLSVLKPGARKEKQASEAETKAHEIAKVTAHDAHGDPAQTWFGLFTDLIFVAVVVQFAGQLKYYFKGFYTDGNGDFQGDEHSVDCKKWKKTFKGKDDVLKFMTKKGTACIHQGGIDDFDVVAGEACLWFFAFWICWLELCCALTRFVNLRGMMDDLLYLLYLAGVVTMAVQMNAFHHLMDNRIGFTVGLCMCTFSMCCLHTLFFFQAPKSVCYSWRRICTYAFATCIFTVGMFCDYTGHTICLIVGLCVICWVSLTSFMVQPSVTITIEHFMERFGILVMIVTGESILALILGNASTAEGSDGWEGATEDYLMVFLAFAIMFFLKNIYFESHADEANHALNEPNLPGSCLWVFLHFPLTFFLLGCGVGFKLLFTQVKSGDLDKNFGAMLGCSLAGAILTMLIIRTAHKKFIFQRWVSYFTRIPTLVLIPVGVYVCKDANGYCAWCLAGTVGSWFWDLTIMNDFEVDDNIKAANEAKAKLKNEKKKEHLKKMTTGLKTCITTIPGCNNADYVEWEKSGFTGPPDEIMPHYLPIDVLMCKTETGHERVTKSVAQGETQQIVELEELAGEEEDHNKDWLGEFTDLIFVAIIIKFAEQIKYKTKSIPKDSDDEFEVRRRIIAESMLYFYGFFVVWLEMTTEFIRFKNMPGIIDDVLRFGYLLGIITMSVQIEQDKFMIENRKGYLVGFLICILVQLTMHIVYYARIKRAARYARWRIYTYTIAIVLIICALLAGDATSAIIMIILAGTIITFVSVNSFRVAFKPKVTAGGTFKWNHEQECLEAETGRPPRDDEPFIERFGLIVMITTGESILALIVGASEDFEQSYHYYLVVHLAFVTMFYMAKLYFASNTELHEGHALVEDGMPGGVCWVVCHGVLAYALLFCGVGFKLLFYGMPNPPHDYYRGILCLSLALASMCIIMIRTAHDKFIFTPVMWLRVIPITAIILGCVLTDFLEDAYVLVFWCMCWVICLYILDVLFLEKYEVARKYTHPLSGWRKFEVEDWFNTKRFPKSVVQAFRGMDGPALAEVDKAKIEEIVNGLTDIEESKKKAMGSKIFKALKDLKEWTPGHGGHGHGHGGHGHGHGDSETGHGHGGGHHGASHGDKHTPAGVEMAAHAE